VQWVTSPPTNPRLCSYDQHFFLIPISHKYWVIPNGMQICSSFACFLILPLISCLQWLHFSFSSQRKTHDILVRFHFFIYHSFLTYTTHHYMEHVVPGSVAKPILTNPLLALHFSLYPPPPLFISGSSYALGIFLSLALNSLTTDSQLT
jgi:hypothetical protein